MGDQVPGQRGRRFARTGAFLAGTLVLALSLAVVLDPDDDEDQAPTVGLTVNAEGPVAAPGTLRVAKAYRLRPRKGIKKRPRRHHFLTETGAPAPGPTRTRRGAGSVPHVALPDPVAGFTVPELLLSRLPPAPEVPPVRAPTPAHTLIRGPPALV
jgi:hypothetical protein